MALTPEIQYRQLFEQMLDGFAYHEIICDSDGNPKDYRFLQVNPAFEVITGLKAENIIGHTALEVLPGLEPFWIETYGRVALQREFMQFESYAQSLEKYFEVRAYSPEPGKFVTLFIDTTDRVKAEKASMESELRHRTTLEKLSEGILAVQLSNKKIIYANPAMCAMLGYPEEELLQFDISQIHPPEQWPMIKEKFEELARDQSGVAKDIPCLRKDRTVVFSDISSKVMFFKGVEYNLGIFKDVTERRQAEANLKKSLQEKELMLAEIHHRVKNNMQIISALLQLQKAQVANPEINALLDSASNRILSMAMVHERLYQTHDLSAIDLGEYVRDLVQNLIASFDLPASDSPMEIETAGIRFDIQTMIPLGLILNELITNSFKHAWPSGKPGLITIAVRRQAEDFILEYSDHGPGLPPGLDLDNIKTLGLNLIKNLTGQINGRMEIVRGESPLVRLIFRPEVPDAGHPRTDD